MERDVLPSMRSASPAVHIIRTAPLLPSPRPYNPDECWPVVADTAANGLCACLSRGLRGRLAQQDDVPGTLVKRMGV